MAPVPSRLVAPIPSHYPPPRFAALATLALVAVFSSGVLAGAAAVLTIPPPTMERCIGAPDPIGCIIMVDSAR